MALKSSALEHPKAVQVVAAVLITKPILDLLMLQMADVQVFNSFSWVFLLGAGVSLLIRHKTAWMFALALCIAFTVSTGISLVREAEITDTMVLVAKLVDCILVLLVAGTVAYFFRYPYIDRRQHWFGSAAERFKFVTSAILGGVETETVDISYTGARLKKVSSQVLKVGDVVPLQLTEINDLHCQAQVIHTDENVVQIKFSGTTGDDRELIRQWLVAQELKS